MATASRLSSIEEHADYTTSLASSTSRASTRSRAGSVFSERKSKTLTVSTQGKVEAELNKKMKCTRKSSRIAPVVKWFSTIILALIILASIAASKISLIRLTQSVKDVKEGNKTVLFTGLTQYLRQNVKDDKEGHETVQIAGLTQYLRQNVKDDKDGHKTVQISGLTQYLRQNVKDVKEGNKTVLIAGLTQYLRQNVKDVKEGNKTVLIAGLTQYLRQNVKDVKEGHETVQISGLTQYLRQNVKDVKEGNKTVLIAGLTQYLRQNVKDVKEGNKTVLIAGLTQYLIQNVKDVKDGGETVKITRLYLLLILVILVPTTLNFFRALWIGSSRKDLPWPKKRALIVTVLTAVMESSGLCLFVFKVLTSYNAGTSVLLSSTVLVIPFADNITRVLKNRHVRNFKFKRIMFSICIGIVLEVAGSAIMAYLAYVHLDGDKTTIWHLPLAIVCLSVAWSPSIQKLMIQSEDEEQLEDDTHPMEYDGNTTSTQQNSFAPSMNSVRSEDSFTTHRADPTHHNRNLPTWKSSWKTSIISHAVKLLTIILVSFLLYLEDPIYLNLNLSNFEERYDWVSEPEFRDFIVNILSSFLAYFLGYLVCHSSMQVLGFAIPLYASFLAYVTILLIPGSCRVFLEGVPGTICPKPVEWEIEAAVFLLLGLILSTVWFAFRADPIILKSESKLFWLPSFNGVLLDQWMLLNRRCYLFENETDERTAKSKTARVYICTTMYRETRSEMDQLLESINRVNISREDGGRFFESHVVFDGGVRKKQLSSFALQLISRLEQTLGIKPDNCTKIITPYGMRLNWNLAQLSNREAMHFNIHLKDNHKVKNKKRWSQVMYMSYVLDFLMDDNRDVESFILTTDADVEFTPDSVEALLDLMSRDSTVGAVCARTHPMGSGPMVWYQVFEYAIGHWFQKASEHVLGSVLCAPGCFSVYRCSALKDILPTYATGVEHAYQFLTKDMGEDRWLCTLMVQSGWRIEYCAASENKTNCPQEFEEFYKQRRRWIASTIANLMLIIKEWTVISHFNQRVSLLFIFYQGALLFSSLISPSTVILIVSGGLAFAWGVNTVASIIIQILISIIFVIICLYASDRTQIVTAEILTFLYAIVMSAVAVGTAEQIVLDFGSGAQAVGFGIGLSVTTIYFLCLAGMFILAALLHPGEFLCLLHALWYLLCLPSGYLILNLYSICNITDSSWGTREEKNEFSVKKKSTLTIMKYWIEKIFFCCFKVKKNFVDIGVQTTPMSSSRRSTRELATSSSGDAHDTNLDLSTQWAQPDLKFHQPITKQNTTTHRSNSDEDSSDSEGNKTSQEDGVLLDEWLPVELKEKYAHAFVQHGFDNTVFMSGMNGKELKDIGIKTKTHRQCILDMIDTLPSFEIEYQVPRDVNEWLKEIGLFMYKEAFEEGRILKPRDLSILKTFGRNEIEKELKITKAGHVKRLMHAIRKLRNPTEDEKKAMEMKNIIDNSITHSLKDSNIGEYDFWRSLKATCLKPGTKAFGIEEELKHKLTELRNSWLLIIAVCNTLWLILITTLASKTELTVIGANPIGLSFIFIFGMIFLVQFFSMFIHRFSTAVHFLARQPYKCDAPLQTVQSFTDENLDSQIQDLRKKEKELRERRRQKPITEKTHLISSDSNIV